MRGLRLYQKPLFLLFSFYFERKTALKTLHSTNQNQGKMSPSCCCVGTVTASPHKVFFCFSSPEPCTTMSALIFSTSHTLAQKPHQDYDECYRKIFKNACVFLKLYYFHQAVPGFGGSAVCPFQHEFVSIPFVVACLRKQGPKNACYGKQKPPCQF